MSSLLSALTILLRIFAGSVNRRELVVIDFMSVFRYRGERPDRSFVPSS